MICFIIGTIEEPAYTFHDRYPRSMGDGRVCIGIQTRIAENLCSQGAISSPFFREPRKTCDHSSEHGRCVREHGHPGCHVFTGRKPTQSGSEGECASRKLNHR